MNENKTVVIGENNIGFQSDTILTPCMNTELLEAIIATSKTYSQSAENQWVTGCRDMRLDRIIRGHFYHAVSQTLIAVLHALPQTSEIGGYEHADVSVNRMERHLPKEPDLSLILKAMK